MQSFDWRTLLEVKKLAPEIETVCLTIETENNDTVQRRSGKPSPWHAGLDLAHYGGSLPRLVKAAGCSTWSMFWRNLTPDAMAEAHGLGLNVLPWTVNDPADMARLIDWRVDGIITDYPDRRARYGGRKLRCRSPMSERVHESKALAGGGHRWRQRHRPTRSLVHLFTRSPTTCRRSRRRPSAA